MKLLKKYTTECLTCGFVIEEDDREYNLAEKHANTHPATKKRTKRKEVKKL